MCGHISVGNITDPPGKSHINKWEDLESGVMNPVHFFVCQIFPNDLTTEPPILSAVTAVHFLRTNVTQYTELCGKHPCKCSSLMAP